MTWFRDVPSAGLLHRALPWAAAAIALSQVGCGATPWQPPPPHGQTYEYDFQGFRQSNVTVVGGGGPGYAYGGAFAFRDRDGVHLEAGGKDPFAQSAPIDGLRFNTHLAAQGARLTPASGATAPTPQPAPMPAISASASAGTTVLAPAPASDLAQGKPRTP